MQPRDEQQLQAALSHGLISEHEAGECRALFDSGEYEDFAACLAARGLITDGQVDRLRRSLGGNHHLPAIPGYEILGEIGRGGMAVVYRARHLTLARIDALKVLPPYLAAEAEYVRRFLREARAAARLVHPNIVRVYDAGQAGQTYFLTMEYVDGPSLESILISGPLTLERAVRILAPIARALAHAHLAGFVHRDVKPSNILLTAEEVPKLTDLGLAKHLDDGALSRGVATATGRSLGTAQYMAPEQARDAKRADARADIYALGGTLYHALTGEPPFGGQSAYHTMRQHETVLPPLVERDNEHLAGAARRLVARMLAKSPENRPQSALEVAEALEGLLRPTGAAVRAETVRPSAAGTAARLAPGAEGRSTLLYGFDTRSDLDRITRNNPGTAVQFSLTRKGAAGPADRRAGALLAQFPPRRPDGPAPAFHVLDFRRDWRPFDTFAFDVHNPQDRIVLLGLTIEDREAFEYGRTLELRPGHTAIAIPVREAAAELDVGCLARITFSLAEEGPAALGFDNLRLEGAAPPPDGGDGRHDGSRVLVVGRGPGSDYETFAPAYLAAQTGDVIEIRSNDTYDLQRPLVYGRLPDGRHVDRDVHVRAGPGWAPALLIDAELGAAIEPRLVVEGSLTLEGLRLVMREHGAGVRYGFALAGSRGSCRLIRCYLHGARLTWGWRPSQGEGVVELRHCYLQDTLVNVLDFRYPVRLIDCALFRCDTVVQIQSWRADQDPTPSHPGWDVLLKTCTARTVGTLVAVGQTPGATNAAPMPVRVTLFGCLLSDIRRAAVSIADRPADGVAVTLEETTGSGVSAVCVLRRGDQVEILRGALPETGDPALRAPEAGDLRAAAPGRRPPGRGAPDSAAYPAFLDDLGRTSHR